MEEEWLDSSPYRGAPFDDYEYRLTHDSEVRGLIAALFARLSTEETFDGAQRHRIVMFPVRRLAVVRADPQMALRQFFVPLPGDPNVVQPGASYRFRGPVGGVNWRSALPSPDPTAGPLTGVRVLDLGTLVAAPMVGKRLAALGADVIKIGSTRHPDALRTTPTPRPPGSEVNGEVNWLFANLNAGKRSISLDLASERGRALFLQLVERAEVMLDSYGIDPLPKFRLTYEDLIDVKPDLVMLRSTVMGRRGPCGNTIATGSAIASAGGLTGLTGYPDDDPCGTGTAHPDYSSSAHLGLVATLAALVFRNRTGRGIEIDFSQVEGVASFLGAEFLREQAGDVPLGPEGNRRDGCLVHGVFPGATSDDWCAIAVATEDGWQRLLARVEADDPVLAEGLRAAADPDLRDRLLAGWTVRFRSDELAGTLRQADVLADEVLEAPDLLTNP